MAQLNYDEKQRVQVYEDMVAKRAKGEYVNDHAFENAKQIADNMHRNAFLREERRAKMRADEDAKQAARQAERDKAAQAAADAFLREARGRFPGTEAQWEAAKGDVLRQWQINQALGADDDLIARKRAMIGGF